MDRLSEFYGGRKIFITGHTGFKGSWLCAALLSLGAKVYGYALSPEKSSLYDILDLKKKTNSVYDDIRSYEKLSSHMHDSNSEIVFHLAAQPLVRKSYEHPRYTYETNVMGTVNVLESMRGCDFVQSFLNITTDKVYENKEQDVPFKENNVLDGYEPYANSKSCSELITASYRRSFFKGTNTAISTARAGNVIGGGDFAKDRIVPDCFRHAIDGSEIILRNPNSIRPYQHVIEAVVAYLIMAMKQYNNKNLEGAYNIGPFGGDCLTTGELTDIFCKYWGDGLGWRHTVQNSVHESGCLKLCNEKAYEFFGIKPVWDIYTAMKKTVLWYKEFHNCADMFICTQEQISAYIREVET